MFANGKIQKQRNYYHTPTTFRAQKRLLFTNSSSFSTPTVLHPPPPGVSPPRSPITPLQTPNKEQNLVQPHAATDLANLQPQYVLPWETPGSKTASLYKVSPPKIVYPAGSRDEDVNKRFVSEMDMHLFRNFQVRSILIGDRPHPFSGYKRLKQYWQHQGKQDWVFDTATTFATLQEIQDNGHTDFYQEIYDLLWFGGVLSYGNIMRETYAIMYSWISADDLPDIDGLCEVDDGVTFRQVIIQSLRIVRKKHTQEIISRLYEKLENTKIVMRTGGMSAFFGRLKKYKLALKKHGEIVSDAYLLRRTTNALSGKHKTLTDALSAMRKIAGASGIPTSFVKVKDNLIDTFQFETPDSVKTEKLPETIDANRADNQSGTWKRRGDGDHNNSNKRRKLPKGSCKHCTESTSHYTSECYVTVRKHMGLPTGWKWCTVHKKGTHYDHKCRRHSPNFPPAPTATSTAAACTPRSDQLANRVLTMLGIPNQMPKPLQQQAQSKRKPIAITPPQHRSQQNFQTACNVSTNVVTQGPQVTQILASILAMDDSQRQSLTAGLADAGF